MANFTILTDMRQEACLLPSLTDDTADELRASLRSCDALEINLQQIIVGMFRLYSMPSCWDDLKAQTTSDLEDMGCSVSTVRLQFLVACLPLIEAFIALQ